MEPAPPNFDIIGWLRALSDVGFPTLLGLILFGNFAGIWVWGRVYRETVASLEAQRAAEEVEKNEWKQMVFSLLPPLEEIARKGKRG